MAKFQPWLKMWVEWVDDPKMLSLSLAEQGAWWRLCTLAKKCAADGFLVKGHGAPLSLDQIADTIRIKTKADRKVFDSMVEKMTDQGSLHWNDDTLVITNFAERQAKTTSETPEAVRERVRLHRERQAVTKIPLHPLTTPTTVKDKDIDKDIEAEVEVTALHSVTAEAILAEIATLHEENFGILTPILSEKFKDFVDNYRGPVEWIKEAFAEAVTHNVRKWAYVEKILTTWQSEGREKHGRGSSPGRGAPAHREDTRESGGLSGFRARESGPDEPGDRDEN